MKQRRMLHTVHNVSVPISTRSTPPRGLPRTSVNVITSLPTPDGLNLTLRTPQPGARAPLRDQSHGKSHSPIAPAGTPRPAAAATVARVLSVWKTLSGFVLRTSQTTTTPSWDATANLEPSAENAVEKDAGMDETCERPPLASCECWMCAESESVAIGANESREPPVMRCRCTSDESPTQSSVRPSGDTEAGAGVSARN